MTDEQAHAEVAAGDRYVVSNEDAFEAWCEATGRDPDDDFIDVEWCDLPDDEANEYFFPPDARGPAVRLELHMQMDDAVFADGDPGTEPARILRELADRLEHDGFTLDSPMRLRSDDGNRVGFAVITESEVP